MNRPPYEPLCPDKCHLDPYRNYPNMQHSPDDAIQLAEDIADMPAEDTCPATYLFRTDVSF